MKKKKLYGKTFLTKPLFRTDDVEKVDKSILVYGDNKDGTYSTSVMGILNGLLFNPVGLVLLVSVTSGTSQEIVKTRLKKKWW